MKQWRLHKQRGEEAYAYTENVRKEFVCKCNSYRSEWPFIIHINTIVGSESFPNAHSPSKQE